ncbi:HNH endonuclease signature motif containing protein [Sphaerothrix gracilis]|uniref:HNH endonuclease n=1 Tax=Sphaerothrix gracilis TaxID=3151835 RepID=UPI0031FD39E0
MSASRYLSEETRQQVRQRAEHLCEYCHASEQWQYVSFTVDHVIPLTKGGSNTLDNLALACFHCNRRKSNKVSTIDALSNVEVALFNPRLDLWPENFIWSVDKLVIVGITPIGRTTVIALAFNRPRIVHIRAADLEIGRHPPPNDPITTP